MNYPNGIKKNINKNITFSNRGMALEEDINNTNLYYRINDIAVIYKKPTPITVYNVDYKSRKEATITKAKYIVPSTTDYNGIYKGKYIDFEAKETKSTTSFSLNNIHNHQIEHLIQVYNHGGIAFIIVRFTILNKTFLLDIESISSFLKEAKRKSIPISYFEDKGYLIKEKYTPRLDYLKIIEEFYIKESL